MLSGEWTEIARRGKTDDAFAALRSRLEDADLIFANLETTVESLAGHITKEPRVIADRETVKQALRALRPDLVNLANNHAFDSNLDGFNQTRTLLEEEGVLYFGAGETLDEAASPTTLECGDIRFGWLGYVDLDTQPSHVAEKGGAGVHALVEEQALDDVSDLKHRVDHVIVSLHWGVEYCHLPSPAQVRFARTLVESGASAIVGHHVHVVQGLERWRHGVIAYNLGNATTTDHFIDSRRAIRQTPRTRSSFVLRMEFTKEGIGQVEIVPIRSHNGRLLVDDRRARGYFERANRYLEAGITDALWRRRRLFEDVVLRAGRKLHPAVVGSLRPHHVAKLFENLDRARRGSGPA